MASAPDAGGGVSRSRPGEPLAVIVDWIFPTPADAGTPRIFHLLAQLRRRASLHCLAAITRGEEAWRGFIERPEVAALFESVQVHHRRSRYSPLAQAATLASGRAPLELHFKDPEALRVMHARVEDLIRRLGPLRIWCISSNTPQYVPERHRRSCFVDMIDPPSLALARRVRHDELIPLATRLKLRLALPFQARYERRVLPTLGGVCCVSSQDAAYLRQRHPEAQVVHVPDGGDAAYFADYAVDAEEDANELVFVGNMGFPPNADAALHLARDIMPLVWQRKSQARVVLIGPNVPADLQRRHDGDRVVVTGFVDDVRPYLRRAALVVSPLRYGAGMKNKLQSGLAMAKAMVVSSVTCEGFDQLEPGRHAAVADAPEDFAREICSLLDDPERRRRMGSEGRELILRHYTWEAAGEALWHGLSACPPAVPVAPG